MTTLYIGSITVVPETPEQRAALDKFAQTFMSINAGVDALRELEKQDDDNGE